MRISRTCALLLSVGYSSGLARAQLEVVANPAPPCVVCCTTVAIPVMFHNPDGADFKGDVRTRVLQASSDTAAAWDEKPWKALRVLAGQTVLESTRLDFPAVKAETKFIVQWLEHTDRVIGRTEVMVYPTNLLDELKPLIEDSQNDLGVLDPHNHLKPALQHAALKFVDLEEAQLDAFSGKLAIVGPCGPDDPEWRGLANRIAKLAQKGTPVVWIQSPPPKRDKIWPSFFAVLEHTNAVVMVNPELLADLPDRPPSQLNLIYFCRLALNPQPLALPELSQP